MSTLETPPSPSLVRALFRITSGQYHQMIEQEIIPEGSPTELLDGVVVYKDRSDSTEDRMAHGPKHRLAVRLLTKLASRIDSEFRHFQVQLPIHLSSFDEPEPDGAVILGSDMQFKDRLPAVAEVSCVIEVADSSLERDSEDKYAKYAAAAIAQYVIVNLRDDRIEVYSQPDAGTGRYVFKTVVERGSVVILNLGHEEFLQVPAEEILV